MAGYSYQTFNGSGTGTGNRRNPNDDGATEGILMK